ncbi:hypothetical protein [Musicola paradisiaca]|uniref:DUF5666 domain-containing protein n=1 Tax=Musicola paradisiaca (strain Ech703) TaxID=579405 RepID=C6C4S1_MUSP7|nr:hypothetical protein [Musicola paradisiaca]ACS87478.1 conserved hypothetical protein [Musicola paradisiaca Ech703]
MTTSRFTGLLLSSLLLCSQWSSAADAPAKPQPPVRGTITAVTDSQLQLTDRSGQNIDAMLTAQTRVMSIAKANPGDIKPDSFIGTAAIPQPDGTLKALEVHVFDASLRGTGEGFRPWESADGKSGTMTNGTVGKLVNSNGRTLTVTYNGGQKTVIVPDDVPIVTIAPGDRSLLKPGAHIVLFSRLDDQGKRVALAVSAGKDGTVPPM